MSKNNIEKSVTSQQIQCYRGTGFGIGQGMVMVFEVVTTGRSYGLQLVIGRLEVDGDEISKHFLL